MPPARFPPAFARGLRHFNAGRFFEAHEAFEELLDRVEGDARWDVLLALVQVAVGYHKWTAGHPGAERMLRLGAAKLAPFPSVFAGLDLARLRARLSEDAERLRSAGPAGAPLGRPPRLEMRRR